MRRRIVAMLAAAVHPFGAPAHAYTQPAPGPVCDMQHVDDPFAGGGVRTGFVTAGPLVLLHSGVPAGGTLVCNITVNGWNHYAPVAASASAHGKGFVYLPPTLVTVAATASDSVFVCMRFYPDDGGPTLYYADAGDLAGSGFWSTSPGVPCRLTILWPGLTQCSDGIDNDFDGWADYPNDSDCTDPADPTEAGVPPVTLPVACSDGVDTDNDGRTDYPNDPDCANAAGTSEAAPSGGCPTLAGVPYCVSLTATTLQGEYPVALPSTSGVAVAGYVDRYAFELPTGTVTLACPVLGAPTAANPCELAGGTFDSRLTTLYDGPAPIPDGTLGPPVTTVRICNADLVLTVDGIGLTRQDAFTLC
jgi:hypothetical protein